MRNSNKTFILVEPVKKTPYPPLGLMKIGSMLRNRYKHCQIYDVIGKRINRVSKPTSIFITSLFTWDIDSVIDCANFYSDKYPSSKVLIGGVAASLLPEYVESKTSIQPHIGLLEEAESCKPDYTLSFERKIDFSISYTSRGCPRRCRFCSVNNHEPKFFPKNNWVKDISLDLPRIVFWDNNWLASPFKSKDCHILKRLGKIVDFNQGLDARLYNNKTAKLLSSIRINPIRFAFDRIPSEKHVVKAIENAKQYSRSEIRVYVLYNYEDSPDDLFYRLNLLNKLGVLSFPMEYRKPIPVKTRFPGPNWNSALLRALKMSLIFYYRKGMITESRKSFQDIYGTTPQQFISKLYDIYEYDKKLKRK